MVPVVSQQIASRDRPSFPLAFGAKLTADGAGKPQPQHHFTRCDARPHDRSQSPLPQPQPQVQLLPEQQCTIRSLDARKPFIASPLSIPSDVSSNPGDDVTSSCSSPVSYHPVLPLFAPHSAAKPPTSSRPPPKSPRPSLPRPRSPCAIDFSALSSSPRLSPATNFGRVARPASADGTPSSTASPQSTGSTAAPPPATAPPQAQWFLLGAHRPEAIRAAATQPSRCGSPDTPLSFVTSPNASSPSLNVSTPSCLAPKARSSLSSTLPPSSPRASGPASTRTAAEPSQSRASAFTCGNDLGTGGSVAREFGFGGIQNCAESNRLVIGGSSRSVSSAGSTECGEPCGAFDGGNASTIDEEGAREGWRRNSESDCVGKAAAADTLRVTAMKLRCASSCGRVEGSGAQAERARCMPRGAGLVAAWGGHASRAPSHASSGHEAAKEKVENDWEKETAGERRVMDDESDEVSVGRSSVSDGWNSGYGAEAEQGDAGAGEEERENEWDWASESTTCLNLESVEQLCVQMEFQKKTIDAIHIVPVPAFPQISLERPKRALSRAAVATAAAGGEREGSGSGSVGWPLRALTAESSASLVALRFSESLEWHRPGDPELWERVGAF